MREEQRLPGHFGNRDDGQDADVAMPQSFIESHVVPPSMPVAAIPHTTVASPAGRGTPSTPVCQVLAVAFFSIPVVDLLAPCDGEHLEAIASSLYWLHCGFLQ